MRTYKQLLDLAYDPQPTAMQTHAAKAIVVAEMQQRFQKFLAHMRSKGVKKVIIGTYADIVYLYPEVKLTSRDFRHLFGLWRKRGYHGFYGHEDAGSEHEWLLLGGEKIYESLIGEYEL